jgi:N-acetyl-anhydromuramyl-L-alanine amidase AmpD
MITGWHWLPGGDVDPLPALGASTFLDLAPAKGMQSAERLVRPYFKGRPQPAEIAQKASAWHQQGCRVQLGNEPNIPSEGFGGGPDDYAAWFFDVKTKVPGVRCYWAGMSPGMPGWEAWYAPVAASQADGVAAHAYGTFDQMRAVVEALLWLDKPLWLAEVNFGAGQEVSRDRWAVDHLRPFLDWCATVPQVEAVSYFAYAWPDPDMHLPTPVDGKGTAIETVLRAWRPPEVTVPDITLSVPTTTVLADPANYSPGPRPRTSGVVIHTTRGGAATLALEYAGTTAWFQNPAAQVSAHLVVGPASVARCVHDADLAWHARSANATHLGIEICQPTIATPITAFQYRAAAEACRKWAAAHGFPLERVMTITRPGLVGHEDSEPGKLDGKTDPGPQFDWPRFLALCKEGGTVPDTPAQLQDQTWAVMDQAQAVAEKWKAIGWPSMGAGLAALGEVGKSLVRASKQEK